MNIEVILDGITLPTPHIPFLQTPLENAVDVMTLDGAIYTDFVSQRQGWKLYWKVLNEDDYDVLKAIYDAQFTTFEYPELTIAYYGVVNAPVRMYINDRNIQRDGCQMREVEVTLTQQWPIS